MQQTIELFKKHNEITIIDTPLDIYLEIPHLSYLEVKKEGGGKALLFTNPIDLTKSTLNHANSSKTFSMPVLTNIFGSFKRVELIASAKPESIATTIKELLNLSPPKGIKGIFSAIKRFSRLYYTLPKLVKNAPAQEVRFLGKNVDLGILPILTTWEGDAAPFITMGQVYTQDLAGKKKNVGMYRLQVHSKNELGLHWQIHKDSTHFFNQYKKAGKKMPVSIALGGDALYTWCGQAPLPNGIYELMLYGLIKRTRPKVVKCLTNPLSVPANADIIIEGWVDTTRLKEEGPFGDHTGFYTPIEPYPVLEISAITMKSKPIYPATVVGKPPLEDKYMGYLTERVFLPLLQTSASGLIDYNMPENGVFHNLILAKIAPQYYGHARQIMHAFWGVGQMSFVKHAIFVGEDAPPLEDYKAIFDFVLNHFKLDSLVFSEGVCDALDHASPHYAYGGKLGIDISECEAKSSKEILEILDNKNLCAKIKNIMPSAKLVRQYGTNTRNPIAVVGVESNIDFSGDKPLSESIKNLATLKPYIKIVVFVDESKNDLDNGYMLLWRVVNNIDARRDICVHNEIVYVNACDKTRSKYHPREWPKETDCTRSVIDSLQKKGFEIDENMLHKYHICTSSQTKSQ